MTLTQNQDATLYWVCVDCYEEHHGVREYEETLTPADEGRRIVRHGLANVLRWLGENPYAGEPLSLISEDAEVTAGMLWEEHGEDCPNRIAEQWIDECECEQITFTWSPCHGCGSALGGAREALTIWTKKETS